MCRCRRPRQCEGVGVSVKVKVSGHSVNVKVCQAVVRRIQCSLLQVLVVSIMVCVVCVECVVLYTRAHSRVIWSLFVAVVRTV